MNATVVGCAIAAVAALLALSASNPEAVVRHRRFVFALCTLVTLAALLVLVRLDPLRLTITVDPSATPLIQRSDPGVPIYAKAVRDFGSDDVIIVAMAVPGSVFERRHLETIHTLTHRLRALPGVSDVESLARILSVRFDRELDTIEIGRLMDAVPQTAEGLSILRERARAHPLLSKIVLSPDERTTALNVRFQNMSDAEFGRLGLEREIEATIGDLAGPDQEFFVAGRPHTRARAYATIVRDLLRLVPLAIVVAGCVLFLMGGSLVGVVLPIGACLLGTLWVLAAMAALRVDVNLITLVLPPMLICVGSVYGVHVFARWQRIDGADSVSAAATCLRSVRVPLLLAAATTCIGFAALLVADIPATAELGLFSILGVLCVTLLSLTLVPSVLAERGTHGRGAGTAGAERAPAPHAPARAFDGVLAAVLTASAKASTSHPRKVLAVTVAILAGAVAALPNVVIDTDMIAFFQRDDPLRLDFDEVAARLSGAVPIFVLLSSDRPAALREPEVLAALAELQERIEALEGVGAVLSAADLVRLANRAITDGGEDHWEVPATREALAEIFFFLPRDTLGSFATSNHASANLVVRSGEAGSAATSALEARIRDELASEPLPPGFQAEVVGKELLVNRSADAIASNQPLQVGLAALSVFALIGWSFRSLPTALVAMVPNVVPVLLFFGVLGAGAAPLSLPTSLIGCIALGIAIDDTMHFLVAYRRGRDAELDPADSARRAIHEVGRPIVMTSVMLVVGFLVILVSGFATLQQFGALTALTMALCLATDLFVLPALLVALRA